MSRERFFEYEVWLDGYKVGSRSFCNPVSAGDKLVIDGRDCTAYYLEHTSIEYEAREVGQVSHPQVKNYPVSKLGASTTLGF